MKKATPPSRTRGEFSKEKSVGRNGNGKMMFHFGAESHR
jgi:hypothetical protein